MTCSHEPHAIHILHHCRDCGATLVDGTWTSPPSEQTLLNRGEVALGNFTYSGPPEMRRAFDELVAERNGWRAENDRHRSLYVEAVRERDQLRAPMEQARLVADVGSTMADELADLITQRDRLRQTVQVQTDAADAAAEAVGAMSEKLSATLAENMRLGAVIGALRLMWDNIVGTADDAIMGFPVSDYIAIEAALDQLDSPTQRILADFARDLVTENDRLRTVVHDACNELDDITEQSGWGSIGLIVQRLVSEFGLTWYPLRSRSEWEALGGTEAPDG